MRRIIKVLIIMMFSLFTVNVYAASSSISASSTNVYVGQTVNINVSIYAGSWNIKVSGNGINDTIVGYDMDGNKSTSKSYSFTPSQTGKYTFKIVGDVTDYETDKTSDIDKSVTVTVNAAPATEAPPQQTAPPAQQQTTKPRTTTAKTTTTTKAAEEPTTTTEEVVTTEAVKGDEEINLNIKRFEIIGYDIDFDNKTSEYTIKVDPNVTKLYIVVEGEGITAENDKEVNIKDKDQITIKVKQEYIEKEYIIKLDKSNDIDKYKNANKGLIICIIVLCILSTILTAIIVYLIKHK